MPEDLLERCLGLVATAENLHSMDVTIKGNASWARSGLNLARKGTDTLSCESTEDSRRGTLIKAQDTKVAPLDAVH